MNIDIVTISIFLLVGMLVLLAMGVPMAFVTGTMACAVALMLWGPTSLEIVLTRVMGIMLQYTFLAAPMFLLMACVLEKSGVVEDLFHAVHVWMGSLRGGLAVTAILSGTIIAAMTGIVGTGVIVLGLIALPVMLDRGYSKQLSCGSIMAGGDLGQLIPPSLQFILYALTTGTSVGKLFMGGVMPGLLLAVGYIAYIIVRCLINPELAPLAPEEERQITLKQKIALTKGLILPGILIVTVLGSIYGGLATPTEAGAAGTIGALLCAIVHRKFNWELIKTSVYKTAEVVGMIAWLAFGSLSLVSVYGMAGGMDLIRTLLLSIPISPLGLVIVMQLILIGFGTIIHPFGILFMAIPIFFPIIVDLGFDPVWFGVLFVMNMQLAFLSPPFGGSMFYLKGVAPKSVSMTDIVKSVWPFLGVAFICLFLVVLFPEIALWLPNQMIGN